MTLQNEIEQLLEDVAIKALTTDSEHWIGAKDECPEEIQTLITLIQDREKKAIRGFIKRYNKTFPWADDRNIDIDLAERYLESAKPNEKIETPDLGRNWYFEGDELVIKKGNWVIDRYRKHDTPTNSQPANMDWVEELNEPANIEKIRKEDLVEALDALISMWNQYCGKSGNQFMDAGEDASVVLIKYGILKDAWSEAEYDSAKKFVEKYLEDKSESVKE